MERSPTLRVRARGPWAIFTRPELKAERVSYPCITPSAARGLLEAVMWKPAFHWRVERIKVLSEIRFMAIRRNEVNTKISAPARQIVDSGGELTRYFADDDRAQRNTIALRDVDYVIEARIEMTSRAGPEDNLTKFIEMFQRRVEKGQHFHQPYLGCRECAAEVAPCDGTEAPLRISKNLGIMLWDIEYGARQRVPRFFSARIEDGVLEVPETPNIPGNAVAKGGAA